MLKILIKEIHDPHKTEQYAAFMDWRTNTKMSTLPEPVYAFSAIIIKAKRLTLKCIMKR